MRVTHLNIIIYLISFIIFNMIQYLGKPPPKKRKKWKSFITGWPPRPLHILTKPVYRRKIAENSKNSTKKAKIAQKILKSINEIWHTFGRPLPPLPYWNFFIKSLIFSQVIASLIIFNIQYYLIFNIILGHIPQYYSDEEVGLNITPPTIR